MDAISKEKIMFKKKKKVEEKDSKKPSKKPDHTKPSQGFMKKFGFMK